MNRVCVERKRIEIAIWRRRVFHLEEMNKQKMLLCQT